MELQKLSVKIFVEPPDALPLTDFIEIFHSWIVGSDGVYHDIADYSHMHDGPGVVLVAKDANVSIDETDGRRGLLYGQKALLVGSNRDLLRHVIGAALKNCRKLEEEPAAQGKLRFAANEAVIAVNDRLLGDNSEKSFAAIKGDVEYVASRMFGGAAVNVSREDDPRKRLNVRIEASTSVGVAEALENLSGN